MASDGAAPSEGAVSRAAKKAKTVTESMRGDLERSELPAAFVFRHGKRNMCVSVQLLQ